MVLPHNEALYKLLLSGRLFVVVLSTVVLALGNIIVIKCNVTFND